MTSESRASLIIWGTCRGPGAGGWLGAATALKAVQASEWVGSALTEKGFPSAAGSILRVLSEKPPGSGAAAVAVGSGGGLSCLPALSLHQAGNIRDAICTRKLKLPIRNQIHGVHQSEVWVKRQLQGCTCTHGSPSRPWRPGRIQV